MKALIADIDGTLTDDPEGIEALIKVLSGRNKVFLVYATGRDKTEFEDALVSEQIPVPDAAITDTGAEILYNEKGQFKRDEGWQEQLRSAGWDREAVIKLLDAVRGMQRQPKDHPYKVSYFVERGNKEPLRAARAALDKAGLTVNFIPSHESFLDVMPAGCDKGTAALYMLEKKGIGKDGVIVAGDSENDLALFREFRRGIVVGNARQGLKEALKDSGHFFAKKSSASGIHEGIMHFLGKKKGENK